MPSFHSSKVFEGNLRFRMRFNGRKETRISKCKTYGYTVIEIKKRSTVPIN